jgi:hypothetical protein
MAMTSGALRVGHCYVTPSNEMRKIVEFDGGHLSYVVRGRMAFPSWDKERWRSTTKDVFAGEVTAEVSCDGHSLTG